MQRRLAGTVTSWHRCNGAMQRNAAARLVFELRRHAVTPAALAASALARPV